MTLASDGWQFDRRDSRFELIKFPRHIWNGRQHLQGSRCRRTREVFKSSLKGIGSLRKPRIQSARFVRDHLDGTNNLLREFFAFLAQIGHRPIGFQERICKRIAQRRGDHPNERINCRRKVLTAK